MITYLLATYPKCGNSALGYPIALASQLADSTYADWAKLHDFHRVAMQGKLPFKLSVNHMTTIIKTHSFYRDASQLETPKGNAGKVIRIIRNPFDTLLSALNFLRVEVKHGMGLQKVKPTVNSLFPYHKLIRRWTTSGHFYEQFTLENLAKSNLLDHALNSFSRNGLILPCYYSVSGGWRTNYESWSNAPVELLNLRYEDLVPLPSQVTIRSIADFLDTDEQLLATAFGLQSENVDQLRAGRHHFFSKATRGYFKQFFTEKALTNFVAYNRFALQEMGYADLCDELTN
jgi:hypothetical protein